MTSQQKNYISACFTRGLSILAISFDLWKGENMKVTHCDSMGSLYCVTVAPNGRKIDSCYCYGTQA